MARTPANQDVPPEVLPLREEGNSQQGVKVEALHQQPEETCHDAVLEENHHGLAAHLERGEGGIKNRKLCVGANSNIVQLR